MRKSLTVDIEWVKPDNPERLREALVEFLAACLAPELHRAVADTPAVLAEARRVLRDTAPSEAEVQRQTEIVELERAQEDIAQRLEKLRNR